MSYQVLALKWRPALFEQVVAQEHVTRTLQNALAHGRIAKAYLFSGPRGVGKTTTARILAKAVNCLKGPTPKPCNQCSNCVEIAEGRSLDVLEIDGASNRGIDEIRNLRENIRFTPSKGRYRVYIVDEVHMLTQEAFNALLKTLEEPPAHVLFVFATTEPHRVPPTILSRCQRFDFKRIPIQEIMRQLRLICADEKVEIDEDSLLAIAKKADGSMRDAQSLLDQLIAFCGSTITIDEVIKALRVVDEELYFETTRILHDGDTQAALGLVERIILEGYDIEAYLLGLMEHLRNLLITRATRSTDLVETSENYKQLYREQAAHFREEDLLRLIKIASDAEFAIKRSPNPRLTLETALLKMVKMDRSVTLEDLIQRLSDLKAGGIAWEAKPANQVEKKELELFSTATAPKKSPSPPQADSPAPSSFLRSGPGVSLETKESRAEQPVDLEKLQREWKRILQEVKKKRIAIGTFLEEGVPAKLEDGVLEIHFSRDNGFHLNQVKRGRQLIQDTIREILGVDLKIQLLTVPSPSSEQVVSSRPSPKGNPTLQQILEMFDGEVL